MIEVFLKRGWSDSRATLGMLTIKDVYHDPFFTLENPARASATDSRIPAGFYNAAPFSSPQHPVAYQVLNVPGRSNILIHPGNFERDTLGCILLGDSLAVLHKDPMVGQSQMAMKRFRQLVGPSLFSLTIT